MQTPSNSPRSTPLPWLTTAAILLGCAAVLAVLARGGLAAQRAARQPPMAAADQQGPLWTLATPLDDGRQMLLLVDQQNRALAIYHVDPASGTLTLKSTRDVRWDLMVEDFNAQEPKPSALRNMLGKMPDVPK
ncbi:MAG: hypothetical protein ACKOK8_08850 [Planctomycetia bacterium]